MLPIQVIRALHPMIRRVAPAFLLVLLAACPTAGMHRLAVDFHLTASPGAAPGERLRMAAKIQNTSAERMEMDFGGACVMQIYVVGPDMRAVHRAPESDRCEPAGPPIVLEPGASWSCESVWTVPDSLPAGRYTAYAVLEEHHLVRGGRRQFKAGHRSNEVPVRIGPR